MLDRKDFNNIQELYAYLNGYKLEGDQLCHWCANKCTRNWIHDGSPIVPFTKYISTAKRPTSQWMCGACTLWKRPKITVKFLDDTFKDGKCSPNFNWWISDTECRAIPDYTILNPIYEKLLNPPLMFSLILSNPKDRVKNELHLATFNKNEKVLADTELKYTLNNKECFYTIYELTEALKNGLEGKSPGVRYLINLFGTYDINEGKVKSEEKRKRGRPPKIEEFSDARILKKLIRD